MPYSKNERGKDGERKCPPRSKWVPRKHVSFLTRMFMDQEEKDWVDGKPELVTMDNAEARERWLRALCDSMDRLAKLRERVQ